MTEEILPNAEAVHLFQVDERVAPDGHTAPRESP